MALYHLRNSPRTDAVGPPRKRRTQPLNKHNDKLATRTNIYTGIHPAMREGRKKQTDIKQSLGNIPNGQTGIRQTQTVSLSKSIQRLLGLDFKQVEKTTWPDQTRGAAVTIREERLKVTERDTNQQPLGSNRDQFLCCLGCLATSEGSLEIRQPQNPTFECRI